MLFRSVTGILNIRPSLFLKNGEVNVSGLCRTRKKSVANVFESCKKYFTSRNIDPNTYDISVASATTPDECDELRRQVEEDFKIKCVESRERFDLRVSSITGSGQFLFTSVFGDAGKSDRGTAGSDYRNFPDLHHE